MRSTLATLLALLWCAPAFAQNFRESPLGAHSAALGQTGVAAPAEDGSALYNPAAFAAMDGDRLSLSTMVLATSALPIEPSTPPAGEMARRTLGSGKLTYAPSSVAYARSWRGEDLSFGAALSVLMPTYELYTMTDRYQSGEGTSVALRAAEGDRRMVRLYAGPSAALGVGPARFGASLFFSATEVEELSLLSATFAQVDGITDILMAQTADERQVFGLAGVAGAQVDLGGALTLGASVRSGLATLGGRARLRGVARTVDATSSVSARFENVATEVGYPDPIQLRAGLTWRMGKIAVLRADGLVTLILDDPAIGRFSQTVTNLRGGEPILSSSGEMEQRLPAETAVDASLGLQLGVTENLSLSFGFLTDRSSAGPAKETIPRQGDQPSIIFLRSPKLDRYWGTLGASWTSDVFSAHVGFAGGLIFYRSADLAYGGSEDERVGFAGRFFFSGGVSAEKLMGML